MKRISLIITTLLVAGIVMAQTPEAFNYQAVARNTSGEPLLNENVSIRMGILPNSTASSPIYSESFSVTTNEFGLFNVQVGLGTVILGDFETIDWGAGTFFLKVELAMDDGSGFFISGTNQLFSVPYALQSKSADNVFSGDYSDLTNTPNWRDTIDQVNFSGDYNDLDNLPDWADSIEQAVFSGDYDDLANLPDWADSIDQGVFSGDYNDLTELPDWSDSIAQYTDGAVVPEGVVESGNLLVYDGSYWVAKDIVMGETGLGQDIEFLPPVQVVNFCIALQGTYPSRNVADPFIGTIAAFGFNFAPRGWATCDGQLLSVPQNSALFSLLGTMYGGDGRTTFGLPDLRGRMPMHFGQGAGLTNRSMGQKLGSETISIPVGALPAHSHVITFE